MQVSEVLRIKGSTLFTVTPDAMLTDGVMVMADNDIGSLVVMEQGRLAGIITFREVLKVLAQRLREQSSGGTTRPVTEILIRDVMEKNPIIAAPQTDLTELRRQMLESHQRYLPVMDGGTLLGVISFHDVARAVLEEQSFENRMLKNYIRNWPAEEDAV